MSQTHRHTIYFWCGILAVIALLLFTLYKLNIAIERSGSVEEINTQLAGIKDHKKTSQIIEARSILKEIEETKATEFKEAQALCMKDVEDAQQKIVNIIRKLEDSAEIVISRGGGDEIIV